MAITGTNHIYKPPLCLSIIPCMKPFVINTPHCPSLQEMASPMQPQSANSSRPAEQPQQQQQQQGLNCPRCDSPNTKFCYYNNYSLTQPRHYCKTCRRYWTRGGALRNVPIGGGCRKSKKSKSSTSRAPSSSYSSSLPHLDPLAAGFHLATTLPYTYPYDERLSIESLSSINQDMHWKLQQQRLQAMMDDKATSAAAAAPPVVIESSRADSTDWFLQTPYGVMPPNVTAAATTTNNANTTIYTNGDWNVGMPSWSDMHQFTVLP